MHYGGASCSNIAMSRQAANRRSPGPLITRINTGEDSGMSIEFLLVTFGGDAVVLADDTQVGVTNHILMLPANSYTISLSPPSTNPSSYDIVLAGTTAVNPKVVSFVKG